MRSSSTGCLAESTQSDKFSKRAGNTHSLSVSRSLPSSLPSSIAHWHTFNHPEHKQAENVGSYIGKSGKSLKPIRFCITPMGVVWLVYRLALSSLPLAESNSPSSETPIERVWLCNTLRVSSIQRSRNAIQLSRVNRWGLSDWELNLVTSTRLGMC